MLHLSIFLLLFPSSHSSPYLVFDPNSATLVPQETINFTVSLSEQLANVVEVTLKRSEYIAFSRSFQVFPNKSTSLKLTAVLPANQVFLELESCFVNGTSTCPLDFSASFARLRIIRSYSLDVVVLLAGWACFIAWSFSMFPQIILNFKRKSVSGLNFDFVLLNTIGFSPYSVYNFLIYFDKNVQEAYLSAFPRSPIPVLFTDVVLSGYALIMGTITTVQIFCLDRGNQRLSRACLIISVLFVASAALASLLVITHTIHVLTFITFLSYIKMVITLSKYFPQALMNYRRQSTVGWAIGQVVLDLSGGVFSLLQMTLQGCNVANFSAFIGNPVKFGVGFVSITFDIVFIIQHYLLYPEVYEVLEDNQSAQLHD